MGITSTTKPYRSAGRTSSRGGRRPGRGVQYDETSTWDGSYQQYNPSYKQSFNPRNYSYPSMGFTGSQSPYQNPNQYNTSYLGYTQPGYQQGAYQYPDQTNFSQHGYLPPSSGSFNPQGGYNQAYYGYTPQGGYNPQGGYSQTFSSAAAMQSYSQPYGSGYPQATSAYQPLTDPLTAGVYPHPPADSVNK